MTEIRIAAPATLSNLGPGFDVLGLAVGGKEDAVTVELRGDGGLVIERAGPYGDRVPLEPDRNLAAFSVKRVIGGASAKIIVEKNIPPGSGLGSSAASAVAAAVAATIATGRPLDVGELLTIGRDAEALAAGSAHLDNVAPALLGGFVAVIGQDPPEVVRLPFPEAWWLAVVLPDHPVATKDARAVLPASIPRSDAIANLRRMAGLLDAAARGDLPGFAANIVDQIAYPHRRPLWPFLPIAEAAARDAGALAWSISGSGPAMFAPTRDRAHADAITLRVVEALGRAGFRATAFSGQVRQAGALGPAAAIPIATWAAT